MRTRTLAFALAVLIATAALAKTGFSYVYKRGEESYTRINGSIDRIGEVARKYGKEFVWVVLDGREYVIRDAATLAEVRNAFRDVEALEPALNEAEAKLRPYEKELDRIEKRVDAAGDRLDDESLSDSDRDALEARLRQAEEEMHAVEQKMKGLEREMERIEKESERREAAAEKRFEAIVERVVERGIAERVK